MHRNLGMACVLVALLVAILLVALLLLASAEVLPLSDFNIVLFQSEGFFIGLGIVSAGLALAGAKLLRDN